MLLEFRSYDHRVDDHRRLDVPRGHVEKAPGNHRRVALPAHDVAKALPEGQVAARAGSADRESGAMKPQDFGDDGRYIWIDALDSAERIHCLLVLKKPPGIVMDVVGVQIVPAHDHAGAEWIDPGLEQSRILPGGESAENGRFRGKGGGAEDLPCFLEGVRTQFFLEPLKAGQAVIIPQVAPDFAFNFAHVEGTPASDP